MDIAGAAFYARHQAVGTLVHRLLSRGAAVGL